jgi:hypothetical protein
MTEGPAPYNPLNEEEKNMRRMKKIVDRTAHSLRNDLLSEREARELIENTKRNVLALFPDKEEEFELIYKPRFERMLDLNPGVQVDRSLKNDTTR